MTPRLRQLLVPIVVAASTALVAGCGAPPPAPPGLSPAPAGPSEAEPDPTTWQQQMLAEVNARRAGAGVAPVTLCGRLGDAAQAHSDDQAATGTMSHVGSDGSTLGSRATRAGYLGWNALAENVAAGQRDVTSVVGAWMGSEGHRRNLLSATYTHLGVGKATRSGTSTIYWTQKFGRGGSC